MPDPAQKTAVQLREEQQAEYGVYVAVSPIDFDGVRAFNAGDPVPASHVERGVVATDQVAKTTTKAGREVAAAVTKEG